MTPMTTPRKSLLRALALASGLALGAHHASANELNAHSMGASVDNRGRTTFQFIIPDGEGHNAYRAYLNWCQAKDTLPSNWNSQEDKTLRTSSMCKSAPVHTGRGKKYLSEPPGTGLTDMTITQHLRGRYILSVTLWTGYGHTHDPYHTALGVFTVSQQPQSAPGKIPGM